MTCHEFAGYGVCASRTALLVTELAFAAADDSGGAIEPRDSLAMAEGGRRLAKVNVEQAASLEVGWPSALEDGRVVVYVRWTEAVSPAATIAARAPDYPESRRVWSSSSI